MASKLNWNECYLKLKKKFPEEFTTKFPRKGTPEYNKVLNYYHNQSSSSPKRSRSPSPTRLLPNRSPSKSPLPKKALKNKSRSPSPKRLLPKRINSKSPSPKKPSPNKSHSPSPKKLSPKKSRSPSPRKSSPKKFNKEEWEKACEKELVKFAKKGTFIYKRVLARYQGKDVLNIPEIDMKYLCKDNIITEWEKALEGRVVLKGDPYEEDIILLFISYIEEKRVENKENNEKCKLENKKKRDEKTQKQLLYLQQSKENAEKEKQRVENLSPRSKALYELKQISKGW